MKRKPIDWPKVNRDEDAPYPIDDERIIIKQLQQEVYTLSHLYMLFSAMVKRDNKVIMKALTEVGNFSEITTLEIDRLRDKIKLLEKKDG